MPLDERFDAAEPFGRKTGFFGPRNRQRRRRNLQSEETAQENGHAGPVCRAHLFLLRGGDSNAPPSAAAIDDIRYLILFIEAKRMVA
jgi:hypothetical protein